MTGEERQRLSLISRLYAQFAYKGDVELGIAAHLEDTADIPLPWLIEGLRGFRDEAGRVFVPSISEIRESCAKTIRDERRKARGEDGYSPNVQSGLKVPEILEWARQFAPLGHAQLYALEAGKSQYRAQLAQNVSAASEDAQEQGRARRGGGKQGSIRGILSGLTVEDENGKAVPLVELKAHIRKAGLCPSGLTGEWIATMLAYRLMGRDPLPSTWDEAAWRRVEKAMANHKHENAHLDLSWWDEAKGEWWERTQER